MESVNKREAWSTGKRVAPPQTERQLGIHLQSTHAVRDLAFLKLAYACSAAIDIIHLD